MRRRIKQKQNVQNENMMVFLDNDLFSEMKKMNRKGSQVNSNNIVAYGWCLQQQNKTDNDDTIVYPVPVPIHCRPLATSSQNQSNQSTGLRIWCAAAVDLSGGEAGFPRSKSTMDSLATSASINKDLNAESSSDQASELKNLAPEYKLSTFTWILSVSHSRSKITIVNMKSSPSEILDSFFIKTHLFCICSVSGAKNDDTILDVSKSDLNGPILFQRQFVKNEQQTIKKQSEEEKLEKASAADESISEDKLANYLNYYKESTNTDGDSGILTSTPVKSLPKPSIESKESTENNDQTTDRQKMSTVMPTIFLGNKIF